jgi:endonuclease/exonuclease/phosphatase family metal-dependent hydrolase
MMRVVTWNIWWRFGPWERRAPAIEATLRSINADVICLQEVWATEERRQAHELGEALGYEFVSGADGSEGSRLGNAVLSRWPISQEEVTRLPLASGDAGYRTLVRARLDTPHGLVDAYSTHLAYRFDESALRSSQLTTVCETIARNHTDNPVQFPPILCGDLNATPNSREVHALTGQARPPVPGLVFTDTWAAVGRGPGYTWDTRNPHLADSTWPRRRLDYVLVGWPRDKPVGNPIRARLAGARPRDGIWPSDHLAVVVDLQTD